MTNIYIQGQLLDQYGDEVIEVTSSVLDVEDITKNTGDFSKTFTIPASPNNNKLFKHWYNASIDNGFDARTKVEGHIDIDGVPFKTGKWRLSEVIFKDGIVDGYIINFFGNLPNIKDTLGDDLLSDINFVKHDHEWTGANVIEGLKGDLNSSGHTERDVIYTPISGKRYFYDGNSLSSPDIGDNINIAGAGTGTGITWSDLRPSIKAKTIIDNIQHKYGAGTHQVVKVIVTQSTNFTTGLSMTLNGIEGHATIVGGSTSASANAIQSFINSSTDLNPYYVATRISNIVTITSKEMEQEISPVFVIENENINFNLDVYVNEVGAFPYENPITFSDDFFQTSEFEQMYLWLKKDDEDNIGLSEKVVQWNGQDTTDIDSETNVITANYSRTQSVENYQVHTFKTSDLAGFGNTPFTIIKKLTIKRNGSVISQTESEHVASVGGDGQVNEVTIITSCRSGRVENLTYEIQYFVKANTTFKVKATLTRREYSRTGLAGLPSQTGERTTTATPQDANESYISVSKQMPDMKIVDFLKGIFDMFKLVIVPQEDGSMFVNSLDSFYDQGNRYDISDKVDYSTFKVKRGELYQTISYQFEEPSTILNEEFQNRARDKQAYGSSLVNIHEKLRPIKLIDGEKIEIKLPFEQVIYERLTDVFSTDTTNISIATITDKDLKPVTPKPLLHYVSEQDISGSPIRFLTDDNVPVTLNTTMLMPMNQFGTLEPAYSLLFESEFSSWDGLQIDNNLYTIHHEEYIKAVFELKRRSFEYEALLPTQLITRLGLNDVLTIEGLDYRINKFKHNLLEGTTKLDLINGFDTTLYKGVYVPSQINMSKYKSTLYFNVPNIDDYGQGKVDTGDGTSWLTIGVLGSNNNMALIRANSVNSTIFERSCNVRYTSLEGTITEVTITQIGNEQ